MRNLLLIISLLFASCEGSIERRDRFFLLGNQALDNENYENAIQLYDESLREDPNYTLALNNRGVAKSEMGRKYEAILDFNQALAGKPGYLEALFNRAYAYEAIGKYKKALNDVLSIKKIAGDSAFVFFYEGLVLTKMRAYDKAFLSFQKSDEIEPLNPETLVNLATVHYFKEKLPEADSVIGKVLKLEPNNPNAFNLLSLIALKRKEFGKSLTEINKALNEVPSEPYFLNNRGYIYLQMDSLESALEDINKSIILNPKNGWAYRNKGIYFLFSGEYHRALDLFEQAEKSGDFIDELFYFQGLANDRLGKMDEACLCWEKGVENNESRSKIRFSQKCN